MSSNYAGNCKVKQVDILISKNQALQVLYFKHHVYKTSLITMDKKLNEIHKNSIPTKLTTLPYYTIQYNKTQTYLITGQPS